MQDLSRFLDIVFNMLILQGIAFFVFIVIILILIITVIYKEQKKNIKK